MELFSNLFFLAAPFFAALMLGHYARIRCAKLKNSAIDIYSRLLVRISISLTGLACLSSLVILYSVTQDNVLGLVLFYILIFPIFLLGIFLIGVSLFSPIEHSLKVLSKILEIK